MNKRWDFLFLSFQILFSSLGDVHQSLTTQGLLDINELTLYIEIYNWIFSLHFFGEYSISVHVIAFNYYAVFHDMDGPCLFNYRLLLNIKVVPSLGGRKWCQKNLCTVVDLTEQYLTAEIPGYRLEPHLNVYRCDWIGLRRCCPSSHDHQEYGCLLLSACLLQVSSFANVIESTIMLLPWV